MLRTTGTTLLLAALLVACGGGESAEAPETVGLPDEDVQAIRSIDRSFQDAVRQGDWTTLRGLYAPGAVHMPPGSPPVEGVDAILAYWEQTYAADGITGYTTDTEVIDGDASIAYHRGRWASEAEMLPRGTYMWVLRRMPSGEWRIVADTYNSDSRRGPMMLPGR